MCATSTRFLRYEPLDASLEPGGRSLFGQPHPSRLRCRLYEGMEYEVLAECGHGMVWYGMVILWYGMVILWYGNTMVWYTMVW